MENFMHGFSLFLLFAIQAGAATPPPNDDVGRTASECGFFYMSSFKFAPTATPEQKSSTKYLQNVMFSIAKENGVSADAFQRIIEVYQPELDQHIAAKDKQYVQSEVDRCGAFAKRQAENKLHGH
jgi:hypothetical protein